MAVAWPRYPRRNGLWPNIPDVLFARRWLLLSGKTWGKPASTGQLKSNHLQKPPPWCHTLDQKAWRWHCHDTVLVRSHQNHESNMPTQVHGTNLQHLLIGSNKLPWYCRHWPQDTRYFCWPVPAHRQIEAIIRLPKPYGHKPQLGFSSRKNHPWQLPEPTFPYLQKELLQKNLPFWGIWGPWLHQSVWWVPQPSLFFQKDEVQVWIPYLYKECLYFFFCRYPHQIAMPVCYSWSPDLFHWHQEAYLVEVPNQLLRLPDQICLLQMDWSVFHH